MPDVDADELREHLAYEVHYLVLAAVRFAEIDGVHKGVYQDSALVHARNLLEFTNPGQPTSYSWWIGSVGGLRPPGADSEHEQWRKFINANLSHVGPSRTESRSWPIPKDDQRLITLAQYLLQRISTFSQNDSDPRATIMERLAELGLAYLDDPTLQDLGPIAQAIDQPL